MEQTQKQEGNGARAMIPYPQRDAFEREKLTATEHLSTTPQPVFIFEKVEYPPEGGIYIFLKDVLYPTKGFPTPEAVAANNIAKRMFITNLKLLAKNPLYLLSMLRKKYVRQWIRGFNDIAYSVLDRFYFKPNLYNKANRQLRVFIETFMNEIGFPELAVETAKNIITLFEYDNAYMFRLQDLANETNARRIRKSPRKEIKRLLEILRERDNRLAMYERFGSAARLISLALLRPKIKKAFRKALDKIDFSQIQMDEGDRYHVLRWDGYNFLGKTIAERIQIYTQMHGNKVPKMFVLQSEAQSNAQPKQDN